MASPHTRRWRENFKEFAEINAGARRAAAQAARRLLASVHEYVCLPPASTMLSTACRGA